MAIVKMFQALGILSLFSVTEAENFQFQNIKWGTSRADVTKILLSKGFTKTAVIASKYRDPSIDLTFKGTIVNQKSNVEAYFDQRNHLIRLEVSILPPSASLVSVYKNLNNILVSKFNEPTSCYKVSIGSSNANYVRAAENEETCYWVYRDTPRSDSMSLDIRPNLSIEIVYESFDWTREQKRRQASGDNRL